MLVRLGRLLLFLLLVCDWLGDPHLGQSPLSRPGSSQDVYCHSMLSRNVVRLAVTPPGVDHQATAASPATFRAPPPAVPSAHPLPLDALSALRRISGPTPLRC
jgi:hypothetical protein